MRPCEKELGNGAARYGSSNRAPALSSNSSTAREREKKDGERKEGRKLGKKEGTDGGREKMPDMVVQTFNFSTSTPEAEAEG
jgi:hypothetical protein